MKPKLEDEVFPEKTLQQLQPKYVTTNSRIDQPNLPLRYKPHLQKYQTRFRPKYRPNYQTNYQSNYQPNYQTTNYQNRHLNVETQSKMKLPKDKIPSSFLTKTDPDDDKEEIEFNYLIENKNVILEAPKQESANNVRNNYGRTENPPLFHTQADFGNTNDKEIEFNYVIENKNLILEVPNTKSSKAEGFQASPNVEEDKTSTKVRLHILDFFFLS